MRFRLKSLMRADKGGSELDHWPDIATVMQGWLDQWAALLSGLPRELALALLLLPITLAIISRNIILGLGCVMIVLAAGLVLVVPAHTAVILGSALYVGSIIVSLSGIIARRRSKKIQDEFAFLHSQVNHLLAAEDRRLMRDIRSGSKGQAAKGPAD